MAGFTTAMPTSFKGELPQAIHNFTITTGNVFKCALGIRVVAGRDLWRGDDELLRPDRQQR